MSSTEPPSRVPPRQQPHETKAARDELSSKGKVEKVREVDPDEETRKQRFLKYYKGEEEPKEEDNRPSLFDLSSGKSKATGAPLGSEGPLSKAPPPNFEDVESAIIPGPGYAPPPDLNASSPEEEGEDEATQGALPQSNNFWEDFDFPDQPRPQANFQESAGLGKEPQAGSNPKKGDDGHPKSVDEHKRRVKEIKGKEEESLIMNGKVEKKGESHKKLEKKKKEMSPFGVPGRPTSEHGKEEHAAKEPAPYFKKPEPKEPPAIPEYKGKGLAPPHTEKKGTEKQKPSPIEAPIAVPRAMPHDGETNRRVSSPKHKEKETEEIVMPQGVGAPAPRQDESGGGSEGRKDRGGKTVEIESPSLPPLPAQIQPMAAAAATQAAPLLNPATVSLFFQMVGTMYMAAGKSGVSRTEVVLNNPSFANSKFFGTTITIEKYATAPDSFNIRLTGSQEAIKSFQENIPSLLTAFQNGNFNFRVGRLDVEYSPLERPLFRRKEKGEDKGEAGGGDLGERKNK